MPIVPGVGRESTVGGSWHWSPTITSWRAPRPRATMVEASVACVASSMRTARNSTLASLSAELPQFIVVQHTTSAFRHILLAVFLASSLEIPGPTAGGM